MKVKRSTRINLWAVFATTTIVVAWGSAALVVWLVLR